MAELDNFRDSQYYAMLKEMYGAVHVVSKTAHHANCACKECTHAWRGECMAAKCGCCTTAYQE